MSTSDSDLHVKDNRMFNLDGTLRADVGEEKPAPEKKPEEKAAPPRPKPADSQSAQQGFQPAGADAIDFATFVLSLASSVQISLGMIANPMTGKSEVDLAHAHQTIDIIGMLEQKTTGNLSPEESGLVRQILFQLRMQYVEISKGKK